MTIEIRATRPEQYRAASDTAMAALLHAPLGDEEWAERVSTWSGTPSISAWDEGRCVAHACQFLVETTVPGGARLPTGAVTRVGVLPSHRRRGVATELMTALVGDAVDRGLSLMSLRATEAVIYQRYGFGLAGEFASINVSSRRATPVAGATTAGSFRILGPDEILDVVVALYDRFAHRRPGVITRTDMFWTRYFGSAIDRSKASYVAVHLDDAGEADGYAHYDLDWDEDHRDGPTGVGEVNEVIGVDD
ncbi:MAG: GNAT family N-acetyltransferase, partial [Ilumatobacteraceae bacterium]